jgi:hypothetical protein
MNLDFRQHYSVNRRIISINDETSQQHRGKSNHKNAAVGAIRWIAHTYAKFFLPFAHILFSLL